MIRFQIKHKPTKFKGALIGQGSGPAERIKQLQIWVTALIRDERIEGRADRMHETRAYAEQLINLALYNGDKHQATMNMADKWLLEKDLIHKLFKVLVPRYNNYTESYTRVFTLPATYPGSGRFNAVLELKENPYPPVIPHTRDSRKSLANILISAAAKDYSFKNPHLFNRSNRDADQFEMPIEGKEHKKEKMSSSQNSQQDDIVVIDKATTENGGQDKTIIKKTKSDKE